MLSQQDIQNIIVAMKAVFPTREEVVLRTEFHEHRREFLEMKLDIKSVRKDIDLIAVNLSSLINKVDNHHSQIVSLNYRMGRVVKKLGII